MRKPLVSWTASSLNAAYDTASPRISNRVRRLLSAGQSSSRLILAPSAGPSFGCAARHGARFLSVREFLTTDRKAKLSNFPRLVQGAESGPDAASAERPFRGLGMKCPAYAAPPGHIELGYLSNLDVAAFNQLVAFLLN